MREGYVVFTKKIDNMVYINPLSQAGGGGCCNPLPFQIFPRTIFAKIAKRSISPPFVQIPMYLWKKLSKKFAVQKVGGWGGRVATAPPPVLRGKGWQQK